MTTAYQPCTNSRTELFEKTMIDRLRRNVGENHDSWDNSIHLLTYAYTAQTYRSAHMTSFSLTIIREQSGSANFVARTFSNKTEHCSFPSRFKAVLLAPTNLWKTKKHQILKKAQDTSKAYFDKRLTWQPIFQTGDLVHVHELCNNQKMHNDDDCSGKL